MKTSRYNIIVDREKYSYWINTLQFNFFRLDSSLSKKLHPCLDHPDELAQAIPSFYNKLCDKGFIVEDDMDELGVLRDLHHDEVNSKNAFLIILPTLDCNYTCWYCIQEHIPSQMKPDTAERVKAHVKHLIEVEKIESLSVDWFGGEPLMYFDEIVEPLSHFMIEECNKANIPFSNGATTNGFYLNKLADKVDALRFRRFQITIDGNRRFHDKVKFTDGCVSTFNHVLKSINKTLSLNPDLNIVIRINYTHDNIDATIVDEVSELISPENRNRAGIMPRKVWQEQVDKSFPDTLNGILNLFAERGFNVDRWSPTADHVSCYSNRKNYCAICPDGHVVKCTACNDIYDPNTGGFILPDGSIEWKNDFDKKYTSCTFDNPRCLSCPRLPLCMGACPRDNNLGNTQCKYNFMDNSFEDSMVKYIDGIYQQREKNN